MVSNHLYSLFIVTNLISLIIQMNILTGFKCYHEMLITALNFIISISIGFLNELFIVILNVILVFTLIILLLYSFCMILYYAISLFFNYDYCYVIMIVL